MPEQASELSAIAAELSAVKVLLVAILVVTIVLPSAGLLKFVSASLRPLLSVWEDFFRDEARRLFDSNKIEELITLAQDKLRKRPNHVYAHWYLARAYYLQEKWAESLAEFREVAHLDPTWIEDHVKPYVGAIERKTAEGTIH